MSKIHKRNPGTFLILFLASVFPSHVTDGATPLLERIITITLEADRMDVALKKISAIGNFTFSYNPAIIDVDKTVSARFDESTVREVLDELFKGSIQYKARGNYLILTRGDTSASSESRVVSGYVVDESTGERLKDVSVYDPVSLSSAVTDVYGYFQIKIEKPSADLILSINKQDYTDTLVSLAPDKNGLLKIPMRINKDKIATLADSVGQKIARFWKTKIVNPKTANLENITETFYRPAQFSIVPFVGTNHKLSGNVVNEYSFNLVGGYSRGVQKLELGGIFNIVRSDVEGFQVGGAFNAVGGKTSGAQFAGMANLNQDTVSGAQFAGLLNADWSSMNGFSAAGIMNFTHEDSRGVHFAGISNMTLGSQVGVNVAGMLNFSTKNTGPFQGSGMVNFAAGRARGVQLAGMLNFVGKEIRGAQISGFLNYATKVKGAQIGFINIADSIKGVPLGFFSFVLKGYHQIEISADEIFYTNIAFRTGVRQFYNIFTVGAKPSSLNEEESIWSFGYGVGIAPRITRWLSANADITTNQIVEGNSIDAVNLLNKLYLGLEFSPVKKLAFTAGVTLNAHVTDLTYSQYPDLFTDYKPNIIRDEAFANDINLSMWWGAKIGVRFL
jgi:hypothetical protein